MEAQQLNNLWNEYQATQQPDINALWNEYQTTKRPDLQAIPQPSVPIDTGPGFQGVADTFKQGVQDLSDIPQSLTDNTTSLPGYNNLANKYKAGTATRQDYEQAFLEGAFNNPIGKTLSGLGQTIGVLPATVLNKGLNPIIARNTGATPEEVGMAEMLLPFGAKAIKSNIPKVYASDEMGNPLAAQPPTPSAPAALDNAMSPLIEANKGNTFAKSPNPLDVGLEANQGISKAFAESQGKVSASEAAVKASPVKIDAPDFGSTFDTTIAKIKNGLGQGNEGIVADLEGIIEGIKERSQVPDIYTGKPIGKINVSTNDLIDARRAINDLLDGNKFPSTGSSALLRTKSYVDDLLSRASVKSPKFARSYTQYKTDAQDIVSRFTGNKALKPFWQPEDAVAYKASLNPENINQPGYSDTTLNRAAGFLDNLNAKNKAGAVAAVSKALPKDHAQAILKAAIVKANKANPSTLRAVAEGVFTASPRKVISTFATPRRATPLTDLAKNAKGMKKK